MREMEERVRREREMREDEEVRVMRVSGKMRVEREAARGLEVGEKGDRGK